MYIEKQVTLYEKKNQKFISGANGEKNLTKKSAKQETNSNQKTKIDKPNP